MKYKSVPMVESQYVYDVPFQIPVEKVARTKGLVRFFMNRNPSIQCLTMHRICFAHLLCKCKFGGDCNRIHLCRDIAKCDPTSTTPICLLRSYPFYDTQQTTRENDVIKQLEKFACSWQTNEWKKKWRNNFLKSKCMCRPCTLFRWPPLLSKRCRAPNPNRRMILWNCIVWFFVVLLSLFVFLFNVPSVWRIVL